MEKLIKAWFIVTLITFGIFKLGEVMTTPYSETPSEGNLYWIVLLIGWPFLLLFIWITIRLTHRVVASVRPIGKIGLAIGSFIMTAIAWMTNHSQAVSLREGIRLSANESYAEGWNQFTNIIYMNQLTFFFLTVGCMGVGILLSFFLNKKQREEAV
ncbi:hypothetical protein PTI97_00435 [Exiguobacterium marinum]|uniref:Uncharacterized protein n=1 Tax=Exiguobacterium marinum TaxID=273528 RepID=A0ABY7X237_9BACL|nr:hypothetical protein [Exiguobacterium marinum]WDH76035.1 hypothetical protein PTI97_00435 [Exiguobacterium marinum]